MISDKLNKFKINSEYITPYLEVKKNVASNLA